MTPLTVSAVTTVFSSSRLLSVSNAFFSTARRLIPAISLLTISEKRIESSEEELLIQLMPRPRTE